MLRGAVSGKFVDVLFDDGQHQNTSVFDVRALPSPKEPPSSNPSYVWAAVAALQALVLGLVVLRDHRRLRVEPPVRPREVSPTPIVPKARDWGARRRRRSATETPSPSGAAVLINSTNGYGGRRPPRPAQRDAGVQGPREGLAQDVGHVARLGRRRRLPGGCPSTTPTSPRSPALTRRRTTTAPRRRSRRRRASFEGRVRRFGRRESEVAGGTD